MTPDISHVGIFAEYICRERQIKWEGDLVQYITLAQNMSSFLHLKMMFCIIFPTLEVSTIPGIWPSTGCKAGNLCYDTGYHDCSGDLPFQQHILSPVSYAAICFVWQEPSAATLWKAPFFIKRIVSCDSGEMVLAGISQNFTVEKLQVFYCLKQYTTRIPKMSRLQCKGSPRPVLLQQAQIWT